MEDDIIGKCDNCGKENTILSDMMCCNCDKPNNKCRTNIYNNIFERHNCLQCSEKINTPERCNEELTKDERIETSMKWLKR